MPRLDIDPREIDHVIRALERLKASDGKEVARHNKHALETLTDRLAHELAEDIHATLDAEEND